MSAIIPDCDEVFSTFFDRWYDDDDRKRKGFPHTRPDMMVAYRPGLEAASLSPLSEACQKRVLDQIAKMLGTAGTDWPTYLPVSGDISMDWLEAGDSHYDTHRIAKLIEDSDPADFANDLLVIICQFGTVIGLLMRQAEPRLQWIPEWPYWESSLYDPVTGNIIPPFHWAIKKFSDYGVDDGCVPKIGCMVHILNPPADLPETKLSTDI